MFTKNGLILWILPLSPWDVYISPITEECPKKPFLWNVIITEDRAFVSQTLQENRILTPISSSELMQLVCQVPYLLISSVSFCLLSFPVPFPYSFCLPLKCMHSDLIAHLNSIPFHSIPFHSCWTLSPVATLYLLLKSTFFHLTSFVCLWHRCPDRFMQSFLP